MTTTRPSGLPFMKMHGLGNDFVVIDRRVQAHNLSESLVRAIANRHCGIGFDQLATIENSDEADAHLIFFNADGSTSAACGNATRCIARHLMNETGQASLILTTERGTLYARDMGDNRTAVNMGHPQLNWTEIPLSQDIDTLHLPIKGDPVATGMGNPHCTFFVNDAEDVDLASLGQFEHHPLYPERTNVQAASLIAKNYLRMRVWERGVGPTLASGSSSCAVAVAAHRRGLTDKTVSIELDGGRIEIDWREDGVWMTGPTMTVFKGAFTDDFLEASK